MSKMGKQYYRIHGWLRRNFGAATHCVATECPQQSTNFNWALIKGKKYKKDRNNFFQLCRSCHAKYDVTDRTRRLLRKHALARGPNPKALRALLKAITGHIVSEKTRRLMSEKRSRPVAQIKNGNIIGVFPSLKHAAIAINRHSRGGVSRVIRGEQKECGGFQWRLISKKEFSRLLDKKEKGI